VLAVGEIDLEQLYHGLDVVGDFRSMIENHSSRADDLPE
jgi:hypothetical protein